jgi:hypothetical protein
MYIMCFLKTMLTHLAFSKATHHVCFLKTTLTPHVSSKNNTCFLKQHIICQTVFYLCTSELVSQTRTWISNIICLCPFFIMFNELRWEVVVCFVDIGGIVVHISLNFLFIIHGRDGSTLYNILGVAIKFFLNKYCYIWFFYDKTNLKHFVFVCF